MRRLRDPWYRNNKQRKKVNSAIEKGIVEYLKDHQSSFTEGIDLFSYFLEYEVSNDFVKDLIKANKVALIPEEIINSFIKKHINDKDTLDSLLSGLDLYCFSNFITREPDLKNNHRLFARIIRNSNIVNSIDSDLIFSALTIKFSDLTDEDKEYIKSQSNLTPLLSIKDYRIEFFKEVAENKKDELILEFIRINQSFFKDSDMFDWFLQKFQSAGLKSLELEDLKGLRGHRKKLARFIINGNYTEQLPHKFIKNYLYLLTDNDNKLRNYITNCLKSKSLSDNEKKEIERQIQVLQDKLKK